MSATRMPTTIESPTSWTTAPPFPTPTRRTATVTASATPARRATVARVATASGATASHARTWSVPWIRSAARRSGIMPATGQPFSCAPAAQMSATTAVTVLRPATAAAMATASAATASHARISSVAWIRSAATRRGIVSATTQLRSCAPAARSAATTAMTAAMTAATSRRSRTEGLALQSCCYWEHQRQSCSGDGARQRRRSRLAAARRHAKKMPTRRPASC